VSVAGPPMATGRLTEPGAGDMLRDEQRLYLELKERLGV